MELKRIKLLNRFHGAGLAAKLMTTAMESAVSDGFTRILLGVFGVNSRAIAFYARQGYVEAGVQKFRVGANEYDDLVLARSLQAVRRRRLPGDVPVGGEQTDQHGGAQGDDQTHDDKVCVSLEALQQMPILVRVDFTFMMPGLHGFSFAYCSRGHVLRQTATDAHAGLPAGHQGPPELAHFRACQSKAMLEACTLNERRSISIHG